MKTHRLTQLTVFVVMAITGVQAFAVTRPTLPEEKKGALIGGLIGAAVGGPIGAATGIIVGGGWIGGTVGTNRINGDLRRALARERSENSKRQASLRTEIAQLGRALNKAEVAGRAADNLQVPIHFKTGSSEIEPHYQADLLDIAQALAKRPDVKVDLAGYADRRGGSAYNQKLSEARVQQVKAFLMQHGVSPAQIEARAFGESRPVVKVETPEGDFFDRRVVMQFAVQDEQRPVAAR